MSVRLIGLSLFQQAQVRRALRLLRDAAPEYCDHFFEHMVAVRLVRGGCGGADACTTEDAVAVLDRASFHDVVELAVTLSHESRHHETDEFGTRRMVLHQYDYARFPELKRFDEIYHEDSVLRRRLRDHVLDVVRRRRLAAQSRSSAFSSIAQAAAIGFVGAAVLRGFAAAADGRSRRW